MFRVHKIELRPTASQAAYLHRCAGTMRFVYNALVAKWKAGEKYNRKVYQKHCVELRQSTPWMREVNSRATYEAADNFHKAAERFFKTCKQKEGKRCKPPTFKKKHHARSLQFSHPTQFSANARSLRITGLVEEIRMRENIRFTGTVKAVTIKQHAGKWFATFRVELPETQPLQGAARKPSVGVDLGIRHLAVLSTGERIENPQPLRRKIVLLRRRQRQVSRKFVPGQKQSHRYQIARQRVARLHKKVCDQRSAAQHQFTSGLVKRFDRIVIEDLNVAGMTRNRRLAHSISDVGFGAIRQQLDYKCEAAGVELVIADRFFASSKTCSCCGHKLEKLSLADRTFVCHKCSMQLDRDLNAAINLDRYQPEFSTPPVRGSRKTRALGLCKTSSQGEAGLFEGANINLKGSLPDAKASTVVIY